MTDPFGRAITYLRVSVTELCKPCHFPACTFGRY